MDTMLPNGPLQVVFSFDTTGSMSGAIAEVRGRISDMLQRLQSDIPGVTTAVVAHGDYCDADSLYLTKHIDFSNNLPELVDFVNNVSTTGGGDTPEAYEVMLRLVRRTLGWQTGSQRVLVVIGDAYPHPPNDKQNKEHIDWEEETTLLAGMGVRIYGVQVNSDKTSTNFFRTMANITGGQHLKLSEFSTLCDAIMAICYREKGAEFLQNWEAEVRARDGRKSLHSDLDGVFGTLRRADSNASATDIAKVIFTKATPVKATTGVKKANSRARKMSHKVGKTASKPSKKPRAKSFASKSNSSPTFRKMIREKVPNTNFRFNSLKWSSWKLAVVPKGLEVASGQWRDCLGGMARARADSLVDGHKKGQAAVMLEMAVQTRAGARRHVMWGRVRPLSTSGLSVTRLLASREVRLQVEKVVRDGCRVWVRVAVLSRRQPVAEVRRQLVTVYDYAWGSLKTGCVRDVWAPNGKPSHKILIAASAAS